ncbi:DUF134 domain-containing protein [Sporomusa acidovorans]|uniref:Uncharacterized protein n=1 Tax=Sporomusa acidovorans (strain ATCC 49682 / DSM 3132 / Mol) TaxID=1123286 RepID=A0ABZ3J650_SPOA4|nr:DUF134 domain-containing protein [Sporomusa acidovorans]OZC23522.1 hypothetical protein SPACI_06230 [Sporomusa acidovorans DSM 3132]SDF47418.1 Protein of unknown function DUF134 [Sporomusa acidovorans]
MPRHCCCGLVNEESVCRKFSPQGQKAGAAPVIVQVEELEALCLKDIKGFEQATCASIMGLSRPTFIYMALSKKRQE